MIEAKSVRRMSRARSVLLILFVSVAGILIGPAVAGLNAVVFALVIGLLIANVGPERRPADQIIDFVMKRWLKISVVLLGAGIDLTLLSEIGPVALMTITVSIATALLVSHLICRTMGVSGGAATLIGVGTAICGASAIAAIAPIIKATREEVGVSLATIFTFNAVALVTYPLIGVVLGLGQVDFGTWAGAGVHDTATAIATGFAYGDTSGEVATLVKLTRTLFLIPMIIVLATRVRHEGPSGATRRISESFPWFVAGFVIMALANTVGLLGSFGDPLNEIAKIAIVVVVASIALTLRLQRLARIGRNLAIAGMTTSLAVGLVALAAVTFLGGS